MNPIVLTSPSPSDMTPCARAAELTTILATALLRTHCKEPTDQRAVRLALPPGRSVHATPYLQEK